MGVAGLLLLPKFRNLVAIGARNSEACQLAVLTLILQGVYRLLGVAHVIRTTFWSFAMSASASAVKYAWDVLYDQPANEYQV